MPLGPERGPARGTWPWSPLARAPRVLASRPPASAWLLLVTPPPILTSDRQGLRKNRQLLSFSRVESLPPGSPTAKERGAKVWGRGSPLPGPPRGRGQVTLKPIPDTLPGGAGGGPPPLTAGPGPPPAHPPATPRPRTRPSCAPSPCSLCSVTPSGSPSGRLPDFLGQN